MKNNELLRTIFVTYNHSPGTRRLYIYSLEKYSIYYEMELSELLSEAESEEKGSNGNTEESKQDYLNSDSTCLKTMH